MPSRVLRNRSSLLRHQEERRSATGMLAKPMNSVLEEMPLRQELRSEDNIPVRRSRKSALDTDTQHNHNSQRTACSQRMVTKPLKLKHRTNSQLTAHKEDTSHRNKAMRPLQVLEMFSSKACRA